MHVHPLRAALRPPLGAAVGELADLLFLLGVHRDDRVPGVQELARPGSDVAELGIPVRVLPALGDLGVALQAVAPGLQQPRHRRRRAPVPGRGQRVRQVPGRQARPAQRRLRIPPRLRLDQRHQRRTQLRVGVGQLLAAAARRPRPRLRRPGCLPRAPGHRGRMSARHAGHRLDSAAAQPGRLRPQQQPPLSLIQVRPQRLIQLRHPLQRQLSGNLDRRHTTKGRPHRVKKLCYFDANAKQREDRGRTPSPCSATGRYR